MFELLWKTQIFNLNTVFSNTNREVRVETFYPFFSGKWGDSTPVILNVFKNEPFAKNLEIWFPDKFKNLHNCAIRFSVSIGVKPSTTVSELTNGSFIFSGRDITLIKILAENLNFSVQFIYGGEVGYFYKNSSVKGTLKALLDADADVSLADWWLKSLRLKYLDATASYFSDKIIFIVPPGKELTSFEKQVYPFRPLVWLFIFLCFLLGLAIIFVIKLVLTSIQDCSFGTSVTTPYLNMFIGFIGGSQTILPRRNFA